MGANVARDFAIAHPDLTRSLIMVGAGAGSVNREQFLKGQAATAEGLDREGMTARLRSFETIGTRASFKTKDPRGFAEFLRQAGEHDAQACAHLAREVMAKRRTVPEVADGLRALRVPTLIMVGDQDAPCVEPSIMMRALIPHAGLVVFPACGHTPISRSPISSTSTWRSSSPPSSTGAGRAGAPDMETKAPADQQIARITVAAERDYLPAVLAFLREAPAVSAWLRPTSRGSSAPSRRCA